MEKRNRRQFLREVAAGALGLYGVSRATRANASPDISKEIAESERKEREKAREMSQKLDQLFDEVFFWLSSRERGSAEIHEGREAISSKVTDAFKESDAKLLVFGEAHDNSDTKKIFLDVVEGISDLKVIAEEAIDHPTGERYEGLLTALREYDNDQIESILAERTQMIEKGEEPYGIYEQVYEIREIMQRMKQLERDRGLAVSLLHHPYQPERELQSKVLRLTGEDEKAAVYVGAHHAMVNPGENRELTKDDSTFTETARAAGERVFAVNTVRGHILESQMTDLTSDIREKIIAISREAIMDHLRNGGLSCNILLEELKKKNQDWKDRLDAEKLRSGNSPYLVSLTEDPAEMYIISGLADLDTKKDYLRSDRTAALFSNIDIQTLSKKATGCRVFGEALKFSFQPGQILSFAGKEILVTENGPREVVVSTSFDEAQGLYISVTGSVNFSHGRMDVGLLDVYANKTESGNWEYKKQAGA